MTIAAIASQASGAFADSATSVSKAFPGNITSGNFVPVAGWKWTASGSGDAFIAGDCTKSAGTATVGTIAMDVSRHYNYFGYLDVALWSMAVTGSGSATMQVGGAPAGSYLGMGIDEFNSTNGAITLEAGVTNSAQGNSGTPDTGNVTSAGAAQSVFMAVMCTNGGGTITPDAAFTQIFENESGADQPGSVIKRIVNTGTTDSGSWTATSDDWSACIASYKEPAAAAGSIVTRRRFPMSTLQH